MSGGPRAQCMKVKSESEVAQSYPTLSDPMDCSLPGSSVHGTGSIPRGRHGNPLQCSYLENPIDRGTWCTTVHGVARSWTLDLIDRVPDELWNEVHDIVQETGIKTIPMEKKCKKENGCLERSYK